MYKCNQPVAWTPTDDAIRQLLASESDDDTPQQIEAVERGKAECRAAREAAGSEHHQHGNGVRDAEFNHGKKTQGALRLYRVGRHYGTFVIRQE